ncbi:hypothetical protein GQR58_025419 [Nymphon striatum]|nr:hypothetical protein GQR58_025419 [Nymphon striatum]
MITLRKESNIPLRTVKVQPFCLFIMPEITKIGDICESDANCTANISGPAYCNSTTEVCSCPESHPVHVKSRKACLEKKDFGEVCTKAEQCSFDIKYSTCEHGTCKCLYLYAPSSDNTTCVYSNLNFPPSDVIPCRGRQFRKSSIHSLLGKKKKCTGKKKVDVSQRCKLVKKKGRKSKRCSSNVCCLKCDSLRVFFILHIYLFLRGPYRKGGPVEAEASKRGGSVVNKSVLGLNDPEFPDEPDGIDFAMLGILIGLIFMFIILCVVLQMFSRLWVFLSITHHANRMSRAYVQEQVCPFISVVNPCTISIVEGGN